MNIIEQIKTGNLEARAVLVDLDISQWTARVYDKKVSHEVAAAHDAAEEAGRYNKSLIARKELAKITQIIGAAKATHEYYTSPWGKKGERMLPAVNIMVYTEKLRGFKAEFELAVEEFAQNYPQLVVEAQEILKTMWKASDYPKPEFIRRRFDLRWTMNPIPSTDIRTQVSNDVVATIKAQIEENLSQSVKIAMRDAWTRLYTTVQHLAKTLGNPETKRIAGSLTGNILDVCAVLPSLNIMNDPALEEARQKIEQTISQINLDSFRGKTEAVMEARGKAADLAADLAETLKTTAESLYGSLEKDQTNEYYEDEQIATPAPTEEPPKEVAPLPEEPKTTDLPDISVMNNYFGNPDK